MNKSKVCTQSKSNQPGGATLPNFFPMILQIYFAAMSILPGLIQVESRGNACAYNAKEDAAGCLQIRPIMVREAQRLGIDFTLDDRWNCEKSMELFIAIQVIKKRTDPEAMARCWNGGPKGMQKESTIHYWEAVKKANQNQTP